VLQSLCDVGDSGTSSVDVQDVAPALTRNCQLQDAHGMMDDTNWSTPLTKQAFKDAVDKFPIGEGSHWQSIPQPHSR
jgi:hypothetical protein